MDPDRHELVGRDILAAYRKIHVPPAIRESAWERLQVAIEDDQAEPSIAEPRRKHVGVGWAVALLTAAALLLVIAGLRRMAGPTGETPDHQSAQDAARTGEPARTTSRNDDESPSPFQHLAPEPPAQPTPQAPSERRTRPSERPGESPAQAAQEPPADSTLQAELTLLRAARAALAKQDATTALRLLGDHARQFPGGLLAEERMVLRAQALCEHGDRAEAREAVQQLLRAYPQSPNAATLATSCQSP